MPWSIERRDGRYCVIKDADGSSAGCHDSRTDAIKQQRALYANEPNARRASMATDVPVPTTGTINFYVTGAVPDSTSSVLTASVAPLKPPRAWFERPEPNEVTPMTYLDSGEVFGHLAPWDTCHAGLASGGFSECVQAPRSQTDYQRFHLGLLETQEGEQVAVGKIVLATGHASMRADLASATKHYDDTGSVGAFVRACNGSLGVWTSGVLRSDLSPEGLRDLRANPPSGDWRSFNHNLELVAALAVPVPGFPIPRSQLALAASGEISALILTEIPEEEPAGRSKEYLRKRESLGQAWKE